MRTIYLDSELKCYVNDNTGKMLSVETDFFDEKCATFVEGYRFVPAGMTWVREDGRAFLGEMVAPWKPYNEILAAQAQHERDLEDLKEAYREGVNSI